MLYRISIAFSTVILSHAYISGASSLPDFNTDLLYDALQPCNNYLNKKVIGTTGAPSLHSILMQQLSLPQYAFIPPSIQRITRTIAEEMIHTYIHHHTVVSHGYTLPRNAALSITMVVRILQDLTETYPNRKDTITCTYVTTCDLIPLASLIHAMIHTLHYHNVHVHIIHLGSQKQLFSKELAHLKKYVGPRSCTITVFEKPYEYIAWAQQHHKRIHILSIIDLEPLSSCLQELPALQHATSEHHKMPDKDRLQIYQTFHDLPIHPDANGTIAHCHNASPASPEENIYYLMLRPHTLHAQPILYGTSQLTAAPCDLSKATYTPFLDPYVAFEDIAHTLLPDNGIGYSTLSTPSGIQYLQRYNISREKNRMIKGKSIPTTRTLLKNKNLTKIWPHEQEKPISSNKKLAIKKKNASK